MWQHSGNDFNVSIISICCSKKEARNQFRNLENVEGVKDMHGWLAYRIVNNILTTRSVFNHFKMVCTCVCHGPLVYHAAKRNLLRLMAKPAMIDIQIEMIVMNVCHS